MGKDKINNYKNLVLDIDGTLVNKDGLISSKDQSAISQARRTGVTVTLCTGRSTGASRRVLDELKLSGAHIFFDGTLVYDPENDIEIYSRALPPGLVKDMIDYAIKEHLPLDLFSRTEYFATEESWRTELRKTFFDISCKVVDFNTILNKNVFVKGGIAARTSEEITLAKRFAAEFKDRLAMTWTVTPALPDIQFINIIDKSASKGEALKAFCEHLEVPLEQVCAIGDGPNDISLLSTAGLSIAMGNSTEELKAVADYVTGDVAESGVAEAIYRFLL